MEGTSKARRSITVRHNFETGHRLPHIGGKCQSLHGHSWWCTVTVSAPDVDERGMIVEYGAFKRRLREWIDEHWDHGLILGKDDALVSSLSLCGKVYVMPDWPTVENVAMHLVGVANWIVTNMAEKAKGLYVSRVQVQETAVNGAEWTYGEEW